MVAYEITHFDVDAHEFHVRMRIRRERGGELTLRLPAWIPGSYMIRDFARNIVEIGARDASGEIVLRKLDKQNWMLTSPDVEITVDYQVYAFDLSVRSAYLDRGRAFFNGTSLFLVPDGPDDFDWQLIIPRPNADAGADWQVATTLPAEAVDARGFGRYAGRGVRVLYDCPVEIGDFERAEFTVADVPHSLVVSDGGDFDMQRVVDDLSPICAEHAAMFGELPVQRYVFLTLATADGYGGLEHLDSTSLICRRADLPRVGLQQPDKGYRQFLGLCSHEYFHLWNVKRIRPARLAAADLSAEVHTELLWAFEGITSYYDELALARSGALDADAYLDLFATTVTRVARSAGRLRQSVAESSFDAWTKFYKQDENAPNAIVSYYAKGALVAFGLDMTIRERSADRLSLDDLMRALWKRFGRPGIGVPERAIEGVAAELVGQSFDDFFNRYVYGTEELPLADWFASVGIGHRLRAAASPDDQGGNHQQAPREPAAPALGARYDARSEGLCISHVFTGGAAQAAGLSAGDQLIALGGERVTAANLADLLRRVARESVEIHYFRRGRLIVARLPVRQAQDDTCDLWRLDDEQVSAESLKRRASWLGSNRRRAPE